jgi:hypothetical protein
MLVEVVIAGFVPAGVTVRRLFCKLMELIRFAWQLQRRDLSHQRWTGRPSAGARFLCPTLLSSLTRALAQAALKASSPTILESGYPTGRTEGGHSFMHLSFSKSAAIRSDA